MVKKLELDALAADLAATNAMLQGLPQSDVLVRRGLESRRDELEHSLRDLEGQIETRAAAKLEFSGAPVLGTLGIRTDFAGGALTRFQDLVAKVMAQQQHGNLGERGVVPHREEAILHITNIVHGSFGFLLEELETDDEPQVPLLETALKNAVDKAVQIVSSLADEDEERFTSALVSSDPRVFDAARNFFGFLQGHEASFRLVSGDLDRRFTTNNILVAFERAQITELIEREEELVGTILGVLPEAHRFEFRLADGSLIEGSVSAEVSSQQLQALYQNLGGRRVRARVEVRRVERPGKDPRSSYTLLSAEPDG